MVTTRMGRFIVTNKKKIIKHQYFLYYAVLKDVSNANYLGVTVNTTLLQMKHIDEV